MMFDSLLMFDSALDIHAGGTIMSTNSIPLGYRANYDDAWESHPGSSNVGTGNQVKAVFVVNSAVVDTGSPTLQVSILTSTDNATWTTYPAVAESGVFTGANLATACLASGYEFEMTLSNSSQKYIAAQYVIGGTGSFTSINITGGIVLDSQSNGVW